MLSTHRGVRSVLTRPVASRSEHAASLAFAHACSHEFTSVTPFQRLGRCLSRSLGLAARFYSFLSLEHPNNNVHNLRLCRLLASRGSQPAARLLQDGVTAKVHAAHSEDVDLDL